MIYLDTHALVLLYLGDWKKLGQAAREAIETNDLLASPAAVLELEFLHEIGRLRPNAAKVTQILGAELDVAICDLPFADVVMHALTENWGRDPFDRLIVANARARGAALVTKDQKIREHFRDAIW